jgi:4-diphosphocytidyl-2-C-methyl-D-erythritol kinase
MITYPNVKVNLGLNVLRKRPDGYHDIETLFVPCLDVHDTLEIISGDDFSRTSASLFERYPSGGVQPRKMSFGPPPSELGSPPLMLPRVAQFSEADTSGTTSMICQGIREDGKLMITIARKEGVDWEPLEDLTARAYGLLDADFDLPPVKIFLEKTAPVGAGLGGGSADASFALRMLSELFALGLDEAALAAYAARLGSDCAFFIYNRPMIGTGRGEVLEPYNVDLSQYELRVTVPAGVSVSTADAYRGIVPREAAACCAPSLREALARPAAEWRSCLVNDFEATVFAKYPAVAEAKQALYDAGATYASMSGSGSAVFGLFPR